MIQVTIYRNQKECTTGFECLGHAEYAEAGADVVCAGVSALVINTVNSITYFTEDRVDTGSDQETGRLFLRFQEEPSHDAGLFLKSLVLGLQGIQDSYGKEYISLKFKEV